MRPALRSMSIGTRSARARLAPPRISTNWRSPRPAQDRVIATVVRPGVDFDHDKVVGDTGRKGGRPQPVDRAGRELVFEAHSTDYQTAEAPLPRWFSRSFRDLKGGTPASPSPCAELFSTSTPSRPAWSPPEIRAACAMAALGRMHAEPGHWQKYYHAEGAALNPGCCNTASPTASAIVGPFSMSRRRSTCSPSPRNQRRRCRWWPISALAAAVLLVDCRRSARAIMAHIGAALDAISRLATPMPDALLVPETPDNDVRPLPAGNQRNMR